MTNVYIHYTSANTITFKAKLPTPRVGPRPKEQMPESVSLSQPVQDLLCLSIWLVFLSAYTMYPWQIHIRIKLPYKVFEIDNKGKRIQIWSKQCTRRVASFGQVCSECLKLHSSPEIKKIVERAHAHSISGANYHFLNFNRLCQLLESNNKSIEQMRLKVS